MDEACINNTGCDACWNFAIVIVGNYEGDKETAMRSILVTMIASIITLPLWLMIGVSL